MSSGTAHAAVRRPRFFTPGSIAVCAVAAVGAAVTLARFALGLGATTNLTDANPWGIWIAIDVACGVALAAGGFTTAFLVHILHRERYHPLLRPALLTAMIGYTFVAIGVATDLGRWWALWHVPLPKMWQPNSVLFEVAMCVMCYLNVLYIEFLPVVCERFRGRVRLPGRLAALDHPAERLLAILDATLGRVITVFVILGIVLSCMHQSSLGTLMVITGAKLHPLWQTPFLPLMFLLSAFSVGFPMVIFESVLASRSLRLPPEREVLSMLARIVPVVLGVYLLARVMDLLSRHVLGLAFDGSRHGWLFLTEVTLGVLAPFAIFTNRRLRARVGWLFAGASMVIGGVVLNRLNVFLLCYTPVHAGAAYSPAWTEYAVTAGYIAIIVLLYRFIVLNFPVVEALEHRSPLAEPSAELSRPVLKPHTRPAASRRRPLRPRPDRKISHGPTGSAP
ncbi:MAG: Ni/Fe-hydrogenase cytochrome b subunit [Phycisphaerales bacterium]|nr:Ni/Fe-hydrogenase cytochrome b subunit [Phycisphaerales bacterium]